jgi:hypothetical protein
VLRAYFIILSQEECGEWILEKYPGHDGVKCNAMAQDKFQWWGLVVRVGTIRNKEMS